MSPPSARLALVGTLLGAAGCQVDLTQFMSHAPSAAELEPAVRVAPPASPPEGEPLYQVLYQDEFGDPARPLGQRARMLGWLRGMALTKDQLAALRDLVVKLELERVALAALSAEAGAAEAEAYGPVYEQIILQFAGEEPWDEAKLNPLADQLREAQLAVGARYDPHKESLKALNRQLGYVEGWLGTLTPQQKQRVSDSRFFLRKRLSALARPGDYERIVGTLWEAEDFDVLRYTERSADPPAMDIGGLWRSEPYRTGPGKYLSSAQLKAVSYLALTEPGVLEAVEVLLGQRAPLDFSPGDYAAAVTPGSGRDPRKTP